MKKFTEIYLILYKLNNRWKIRLFRCHSASDAEEKFRSSRIFKNMIRDDGDRYMIFVFTGVEDYV